MSWRRGLVLAAWMGGVLVLGGAWGAGSELRETAIVKAVRNARLAVVNIRGEKTLLTPGASYTSTETERRVKGMGTGVVIDPRGYVLTNHHVVDGVREIQVTLDNGKKYTAKLIARHPGTDLAIIKLNLDAGQTLPVIRLGTSSDLMPGEEVIAVGNAFGYEHTVTRGIISALGRPVQVGDDQFYDDVIQTDASINPGNSGGPLLNVDGEMIGVNAAVRSGAQGIGFAIPVDKAIGVAADLMAAAGQAAGWHGIVLAKGKPGEPRVVVASVEKGSPAEKAGVKPGDRIVKAGDLTAERPLDFYRAVLELQPGQAVAMALQRGDEKLDVSVALADAPAGTTRPTANVAWDVLGLELKTIPPEEFRKQFPKFAAEYGGGMVVGAVRPQSPASEHGIRRGDVLIGLHVWETTCPEYVNYVLSQPDFASFHPLYFRIIRDSRLYYGHLPIAAARTQATRK